MLYGRILSLFEAFYENEYRIEIISKSRTVWYDSIAQFMADIESSTIQLAAIAIHSCMVYIRIYEFEKSSRLIPPTVFICTVKIIISTTRQHCREPFKRASIQNLEEHPIIHFTITMVRCFEWVVSSWFERRMHTISMMIKLQKRSAAAGI